MPKSSHCLFCVIVRQTPRMLRWPLPSIGSVQKWLQLYIINFWRWGERFWRKPGLTMRLSCLSPESLTTLDPMCCSRRWRPRLPRSHLTAVLLFQLEQKQVVPPFKPNISGEFGLDNFDAQFTNEPIQLTPDDEWVPAEWCHFIK